MFEAPISMMAQAVFPRIARERNIRFVNRVMFLVAGAALLAYICVCLCSDWIVYLFIGQYMEETCYYTITGYFCDLSFLQ